MVTYQWTSASIAIAVSVAIIWLVRRSRLHPALAAWWVFVAVLVAAAGMFPASVDWLAAKLDVSYSPTLAGLIGVAVLLIKVLKTDIERTKEQYKVRILAQKVAMLEALMKQASPDHVEDKVSVEDQTEP